MTPEPTRDPTSEEALGQSPTASSWRAGARRAPEDPRVLRAIQDLQLRVPVARSHRDMLAQLGSQMTFAAPCRVKNADRAEVALVGFSQAIEAAFGITQEVMLFYSPYADLQRRTFDAARMSLRHLPRQATPDLIMLYSPDPRAQFKLEDWSSNDFLAIPLPPEEFSGPPQFLTLLRQHIYTRDLYYETTPVSGEQFFGRRPLLQSLRSDVRDGRVAGIFGLRKAGKTSVLTELQRLTESEDSTFLLMDLETIPSPPENPVPDLLADLRADLTTSLQHRPGALASLRSISPEPSLAEFRRGMKEVLSTLHEEDHKITLALDEIEYLVPAERIDIHEGDMPAVAQFLGMLRSLAQENSNFTFVVSGLTSALIESGRLYGRPNPLFSWAKTYFISPFSRAEADDMARSVGQRMGIELQTGALEALFEATGGHAFLYRHLASSVVATLPVDVMKRVMTRSDVLRSLERWQRDVAGNISEMVNHVRRYYSEEAFLLDTLQRNSDEFHEFASEMPGELGHLLQLGLIEQVDHEFQLTPVLQLI